MHRSQFVILLDVKTLCSLDVTENDEDKFVGAGTLDSYAVPAGLPQAVQIAVLNLLAQNMQLGTTYPNIAHFLPLGTTNMLSPYSMPCPIWQNASVECCIIY
jgi:hypothetical protein